MFTGSVRRFCSEWRWQVWFASQRKSCFREAFFTYSATATKLTAFPELCPLKNANEHFSFRLNFGYKPINWMKYLFWMFEFKFICTFSSFIFDCNSSRQFYNFFSIVEFLSTQFSCCIYRIIENIIHATYLQSYSSFKYHNSQSHDYFTNLFSKVKKWMHY